MRVAGVDDATILRHRETALREALARLQHIAAEAGLAVDRWHPLMLQGGGAAEALWLGSVTKHVLARARCGVLVARP